MFRYSTGQIRHTPRRYERSLDHPEIVRWLTNNSLPAYGSVPSKTSPTDAISGEGVGATYPLSPPRPRLAGLQSRTHDRRGYRNWDQNKHDSLVSLNSFFIV
ncbi:MAG: hypothetical protein C5S48_05905 [Candidatus Methanogaster sp.]|nr:MAG: hypothetical protein C5S48_05905 [ANME-2 cluster archaeon]